MERNPYTGLERALWSLAAAALLLGVPGTAASEEPIPGSVAQSVIEDRALGDVNGAVQVNQTAGNANVQANAGAIAIGAQTPGRAVIRQRTASGATDNGAARARIGAGAFSGASGWIAVNQSAGQANAQGNALTINVGIDGEQLGEADLAAVGTAQQTRPGPDGRGEESAETAEIDPSAFAGASGVIQVNQAAGSGNATSNRFELHVDSAIEP
ncbi:hypothetical protein [Halofilum ochraceum]|uniref:hypothetical protein n=1 Tax=Halofilum ochraceum TaxID=1611323 RepID=UPI00083050A7|nr:hypothetical protein [Halofilum ochraceum]